MAYLGEAAQGFIEAFSKQPDDEKRTRSATVSFIDNEGIIWVRFVGADSDTPVVQSSATVNPGDFVEVVTENGRARIYGNVSNPSAQISYADTINANALQALNDAQTASNAAVSAQRSADSAAGAAANAQQSASAAATAAAQAVADAATAQESASEASDAAATAGIAASVAQAAAEAAQGDIDEMENWFYHDTLGAHVLGDSDGYRTDVSSTGMQVVDTSDQQPVVSVGASGGQFGKSSGFHLVLLPTELSLRDPNDLRVAYIEVDSQGNSLFYVANAVIVDDLRFGGGDWKWAARQNRNLSLKWLGGNV